MLAQLLLSVLSIKGTAKIAPLLVAMLLAAPVVLGALAHTYSPSGSSRAWVRYPGLVLCGVAVHFLVLLFSVGVPVLHLGALLVLMTLLVAALLF